MSKVFNKSLASAPVRFTGDVAMGETIVEDRRWKIRDIRLHLSAAGAAGDFTMITNSILGPAYDTVVFLQDMTYIEDLIWIPTEDVVIEALDVLNIAWVNGSGRTYGLEIRQDFV